MTNKEIAGVLEEIGTYMRLAGENDFRAMAFDRAARTLESLEEKVADKIEDGTLTDIKGIGKSIAQDISQYYNEGKVDVLESLKEQVPEELTRWLDISGLGPKKIYKIHDKLGINTLEELKEKCEDGSVASLSGMGKKSAAKILKSIEWMEQFSERCRLDEAMEIGQRFYDFLKNLDGVKQIDVAGSLRRRKETIGDIDILISAAENDRSGLFDSFTGHESVVEILGRGDTKSSVRVEEGRQVDLRIVDKNQFDAALMYFTGSKEHNVVMRQRARERGMSLNEYGLFKLDDEGNTNFDERVDAESEKEIYAKLDMNFVPPELREDHGEFDLLSGEQTVRLLETDDIKGVLHAHSTYSDGKYSIKEMAEACIERGYSYLGLTDHSQSAAYAGGLTPERVFEQWKEVDELNNRFAKENIDFTVFKGIESDILANGDLDYSADVLKDFDFIIASVHSSIDMPVKKMLDRYQRAIENPYTTMLGHPTGRLLLKREGSQVDLNTIIEWAAERGVAIEINASPWRLDLDWRYGRKARKEGLLSAICPDAHSTEGIDDIPYGVSIARKAGFGPEHILNTKSTEDIKEWFRNR